ncbi:metallophosphoesterase [Halorutilales archaeon Cl-col2-1]
MLVLGDAHADDPEKRRALLDAYESTDDDVALQVGDLLYYDLPYDTYFIAGNNEEFDVIDILRRGETVDNLCLVSQRQTVEVEGLRIAGLSGNYAPTKYASKRDELEGDDRRHFTRGEVEAAKRLEDVDLFLAHEAPHGLLEKNGYDVGKTPIDEILRSVEPQLCLVGHHHKHAESVFGETRVVSLAPVWESYYRLDPESLILKDKRT